MNGKGLQSLNIRPEHPGDQAAIHAVNASAFKTDSEARVVDLLRERCRPFISLVAEVDEQVVGHILFTPVQLYTAEAWIVEGMGLAPLTVLPEYQNRGIGSALCESGLAELIRRTAPFVVVLGHPGYYPRFGFVQAIECHIQCAYPDVPSEAFMIKVFDQAAVAGLSGVIHYRPEFDAVT